MKIETGTAQMIVDLPKLKADKYFTIFDKSTKSYKRATHIERTPFWTSHFALAICGSAGSGKTSTMTSVVCSEKEGSRVYCGCFDKIILNINPASLKSLKSKPFEEIPDDQIYPEFNEQFLDQFGQMMESNADAEEPKDYLLIIDDAVTRLRGSKRITDKFLDLLNTRRHLKFSVIMLCQDLIQMSLPMRNALNGMILFKQPNNKRQELIREEFLNLNHEDYRSLVDYVWQKKGDSLMIKMDGGNMSFYKNFMPLKFYCGCPSGNKKCNLPIKAGDTPTGRPSKE
jgi:hypothetical protein